MKRLSFRSVKCLPRKDRYALLVVAICETQEKGTEGLRFLRGSRRYQRELSAGSYPYQSSSTSAVIVMQATQDR